jgi:DnaJ-class molecular chaperone
LRLDTLKKLKILELPYNAKKDEVKRQFKKLAVKYHPDKNIGNEKNARLKFEEIHSAYKALMALPDKVWI